MPPYPLGRRELSADFAGTKASNLSLTKRPDALTFDYLVAFSQGPVDIADLTEGIIARPWYVRADNTLKKVFVARGNDANDAWESEIELFMWTGDDINEVDFAFEQAGRPVVCAERTISTVVTVWLYWFDPDFGSFQFEQFDTGRTPRLVLDNPPDITRSDVQFFYLQTGNGLVVRTQREAYAVANATPHVEELNWYLEDVFYTDNWRIAVILVKYASGGTYNEKRMETTLMPVYFTPILDKMTSSGALLSLDNSVVLIIGLQYDKDGLTNSFTMTSVDDHELLIIRTLYDKDGFVGSVDFNSITDHELLIIRSMYDKDGFTSSGSLTSISDVEILLFHTLFDKDGFTSGVTFNSIDDS